MAGKNEKKTLQNGKIAECFFLIFSHQYLLETTKLADTIYAL